MSQALFIAGTAEGVGKSTAAQAIITALNGAGTFVGQILGG